MIKKYVCLTIAFFLLIAFTSCTKQLDSIHGSEDYLVFAEPDITKLGLLSSEYSDLLGFSMEDDYTSIVASVENQVYQIDFESIPISVVDENPGKAFWLFSIPFLKHKTEKETILIPFNPKLQLNAYGEKDLWGICGTVGNTTESNKTRLTLRRDNYVYSFIPGTYIICVYVGDRVLELPITLE